MGFLKNPSQFHRFWKNPSLFEVGDELESLTGFRFPYLIATGFSKNPSHFGAGAPVCNVTGFPGQINLAGKKLTGFPSPIHSFLQGPIDRAWPGARH